MYKKRAHKPKRNGRHGNTAHVPLSYLNLFLYDFPLSLSLSHNNFPLSTKWRLLPIQGRINICPFLILWFSINTLIPMLFFSLSHTTTRSFKHLLSTNDHGLMNSPLFSILIHPFASNNLQTLAWCRETLNLHGWKLSMLKSSLWAALIMRMQRRMTRTYAA